MSQDAGTRSPNSYYGRLGAQRRHHPNGDHSELERKVATDKISHYVQKVLDAAPPLTAKQRTDIARIVRTHPGRTS